MRRLKAPHLVTDNEDAPSSSVRPAFLSSAIPLPIDRVVRWTLTFNEEDRLPMFVIPGNDRQARSFYFQRYLSPKWERFRVGTIEDVYGEHTLRWLSTGVLEDASDRIRVAQIPSECRDGLPMWCPPVAGAWELFWGLIGVEDFTIEAPLMEAVDHKGYLAHDLYRLIWEARFLSKESVNLTTAQTFVQAVLTWATAGELSGEQQSLLANAGVTSRVETLSQQADLLCMMVTLAAQNALVNRLVMTFDGLEKVLDMEATKRQQLLRGLSHFIEAVDRWVRTGGCPIGVLIGFSDTRENRAKLKEHHPKLAARVEDGLAWTSANDS